MEEYGVEILSEETLKDGIRRIWVKLEDVERWMAGRAAEFELMRKADQEKQNAVA